MPVFQEKIIIPSGEYNFTRYQDFPQPKNDNLLPGQITIFPG
jgi:hypothetical protein